MTARQVVEAIDAHLGVPAGPETVDEFLAGDPDREVRGVALTMMATLDVLQRAAERGLDLVISHEPLYFSHREEWTGMLQEQADPVHAAKAAFIAEHGLVVRRLHDAVHEVQPDQVNQGTARRLGWLELERPGDPGVVFDLPTTTLGELASHVAATLRATALRYVGDPEQSVSVVGIQLGFWGFEHNRALLARPDVDVLIIGEGHEWETGEYAADAVTAGLAAGMVVVGHIPSEQQGMAEVARWLAPLLPEVQVQYLATADPFRTVSI